MLCVQLRVGNADTGLPAHVNGFHRVEAYVHSPVHRRARGCQHAGNRERQAVMTAQAVVPGAMGDDDGCAHRITQRPGNLGAEHGLEAGVEGRTRLEGQGPVSAEADVVEVSRRGAHHPIPAMRISQRYGYGPGDGWMPADLLEALVAEVGGGISDAENTVEQQLHRTGPGTDDEVRARHRLVKFSRVSRRIRSTPRIRPTDTAIPTMVRPTDTRRLTRLAKPRRNLPGYLMPLPGRRRRAADAG